MPKSSRSVHSLTVSVAFVIAGGCLEANPYADTGTAGDTSDTNGSADTEGTTETTGEELCDGFACGMGLETHAFSVQGEGPYTRQIPKPPQAHTVPFATVHVYEPGNSDDYGYEISWSESDTSWTLEITTAGGAGNSRLRGVAAVLGLGTDVGEPALQDAELLPPGRVHLVPVDVGECVHRRRDLDLGIRECHREAPVHPGRRIRRGRRSIRVGGRDVDRLGGERELQRLRRGAHRE